MDQKEDREKNSDSTADSMSAVLIILIPVAAIIYWLSGLPTS
ncbi:methionine synthase [Gammaproteobacteria bacterium]|nr:methionine synthase [Gammaproteobacteria bacterium]